MPQNVRVRLVLAAALTLAVSACTGSVPPAAEPAVPAVTPGPPLAGPDDVVIAWCDRFAARSATSPDTKVHVVTVTAHSMADGSRVAERSAALPDGASVEPLCGQERRTAASADRQLFDTGFGLIAGTVRGPGDSGTVATAFTLPGGRQIGGKAPEGGSPAFQAGTSVLWYETGARQIVSRDLTRAGAATESHGAAPGPDFALVDGRAWLTRPMETKPDQVVAAPGGAVAAGTGFWRRDAPAASYGAEYVDPVAIGAPKNGSAVLPGSEQVRYCAPRLWTRARTLLCVSGENDNLLLLDFAADLGRVDSVTTLLPTGSRYIVSSALSPDGRSLAYLATDYPYVIGEDEETGLYRIDLTPGARPVFLGVVPTSLAAETDAGTPHLVAWL